MRRLLNLRLQSAQASCSRRCSPSCSHRPARRTPTWSPPWQAPCFQPSQERATARTPPRCSLHHCRRLSPSRLGHRPFCQDWCSAPQGPRTPSWSLRWPIPYCRRDRGHERAPEPFLLHALCRCHDLGRPTSNHPYRRSLSLLSCSPVPPPVLLRPRRWNQGRRYLRLLRHRHRFLHYQRPHPAHRQH